MGPQATSGRVPLRAILACALCLLPPSAALASSTAKVDRKGDAGAKGLGASGRALDILRVDAVASSQALQVTVALRGDFERAMRARGMRRAAALIVLRRRNRKRALVVGTVGSGRARETLASVGKGPGAAVVRRGRKLSFYVDDIDARRLRSVRVKTLAPPRSARARAGATPVRTRLRRLVRRRAADVASVKIDAGGSACAQADGISGDLSNQIESMETDAERASGGRREELDTGIEEARTLYQRLLDVLSVPPCDVLSGDDDFDGDVLDEEATDDPGYPLSP